MKNLSIEDALKTYQDTIQLPNNLWQNWVQCVHSSLLNGKWHGGDSFEPYAKQVFDYLNENKTTSHADSN
jgi:hypothetical protein